MDQTASSPGSSNASPAKSSKLTRSIIQTTFKPFWGSYLEDVYLRHGLFARETNWPKNIVTKLGQNNKNVGNMPNLKSEGEIKRIVLLLLDQWFNFLCFKCASETPIVTCFNYVGYLGRFVFDPLAHCMSKLPRILYQFSFCHQNCSDLL